MNPIGSLGFQINPCVSLLSQSPSQGAFRQFQAVSQAGIPHRDPGFPGFPIGFPGLLASLGTQLGTQGAILGLF